jgi:hypothetical protein
MDSEEREREMEQEYGIDVTPQPISRKSIGTLMYSTNGVCGRVTGKQRRHGE